MNYGLQIELLTADKDKYKQQRDDLLAALRKIASIEDNMFGGDWDEIHEARNVAKAAIKKAELKK